MPAWPVSVRTGGERGGERPLREPRSEARLDSSGGLAGVSPSVRRRGDPVLSPQRKRDG